MKFDSCMILGVIADVNKGNISYKDHKLKVSHIWSVLTLHIFILNFLKISTISDAWRMIMERVDNC